MVISINPFKSVSELYTDDTMMQYAGEPDEELPPHLYSTAQAAYKNLLELNKYEIWVAHLFLICEESSSDY